MASSKKLAIAFQISVSVGAITLMVLHLSKPQLKVDAIAVSLFILAMLPWLYGVVQSLELPGGFKISFRELEKAAEQVIAAAPNTVSGLNAAAAASSPSINEPVFEPDPNLALAGLRMNIERQARALAVANGIENRHRLGGLLATLGSRNVLPSKMVEGLQALVRLCNEAVHGGKVDPDTAEWAMRTGPEVLSAMRAYLPSESGEYSFRGSSTNEW